MAKLDGPEPPEVLAAVASTPLGLWLLHVAAKRQVDPGVLLSFPTAEALRRHLFSMLIPALIKDRPRTTDSSGTFHPRRQLGWKPLPGAYPIWTSTTEGRTHASRHDSATRGMSGC